MANPISQLKINNFQIQFHDTKILDLMVTSANIPGMMLGQIEYGRPVVKDKRPGDNLEFSDLSVTILCDENLKAFEDIYNYIIMSANPDTGELTINDNWFDCSFFVTSNKNNPIAKIQFYNAFFKSIGDLQFESTTTEGEGITFTADLAFSYYKFIRL